MGFPAVFSLSFDGFAMSLTELKNTHSEVEDDWFTRAFDALYPIIYAHRTVEAATAESAFAIEQLQLCPSGSVLDLCCGNGRHMVHLLKHTPHVFGLDYSTALLGFAREQLGATGALLRADMRAIPFENAFDAVANFFTSFGYFQTDEENLAVAEGIARSLKPGGRFFMDYLNPEYVRAHLVAESSRRADSYDISEHRWVDDQSERVNKVMKIHRDGKLVSQTSESVKLYTPDVLQSLLAEAGLVVENRFGNYDGSPVGPDNPRQILVGVRN